LVDANPKSATRPAREATVMSTTQPVLYHHSILTDDDLHLFNEGSHFHLFDKLGSRPMNRDGVDGAYFAVWAPNAEAVSVMGDFNGWDKESHPLAARGSSGIWDGFVPDAGRGTHYKYYIRSRHMGYKVEKSDPFSIFNEMPPKTASIVWDLEYAWGDAEWMARRKEANALDAPMSIYEVHLGSWRKKWEAGGDSLSFRELAPELAAYANKMGFTHIEMMPVMEHPFYGSWGYQVTCYFAPTSRFGTPQDFMYLVDYLHREGIGVILDWVPSHFATDECGLCYFDGTHLFEHSDKRLGFHPDWGSFIFNYGRNEVRAFLISNALYWLEKFHVDGLRVDAVASMLYRDYSRRDGEWIPNAYGGKENIEAIEFLRRFNEEVYRRHPDAQTIAEESTAWPMVSRPTSAGGLGFGMKWDMGWMHDTLVYMSKDPVHRKFHHGDLTFRMLYAFTENFVLPLSHDEVVHGKGSLLAKMPGEDRQKFANLRLLLGGMFAQPGKKLLFMGGEFGNGREWNHDTGLDWHLVERDQHKGVQRWVEDLNKLYRSEGALHRRDSDWQGFEWIDCNDGAGSTLSFLRRGDREEDAVLVVFNFTPVTRVGFKVGVPRGGWWKELINSDAQLYWGSGVGNAGGAGAVEEECHGREWHLKLVLPPLSMVMLKGE
jgi:1,4-alpha-glucan branching enzyme